ncbi:MAG: GntR family transcriptional regulator [Microbacterium sp.]|nr:GntR family transcriptional regulator [Microbacterium sp.]
METSGDLAQGDGTESPKPADSQRRAHEKVRELILLGELTPGAWVSQVELAARLELSRTPLREALRRLEAEGLIQLDFNRRLRVAPLSVDDLESMYAMRITAEPLAVRLSVPLLSDDELEAAADALHRLVEAGEQGREEEVFRYHRDFHLQLISHAETRLRGHVESLWEYSVRYIRIYQPTPRYRVSLILMSQAEHEDILAAAMKRDARLASRLVAEHLARTALTVLATVAGAHDPRSVREALRFVLEEAPPR